MSTQEAWRPRGLRNGAEGAWRLQAWENWRVDELGSQVTSGTLELRTLRWHSGLGGSCEAPGLGEASVASGDLRQRPVEELGRGQSRGHWSQGKAVGGCPQD